MHGAHDSSREFIHGVYGERNGGPHEPVLVGSMVVRDFLAVDDELELGAIVGRAHDALRDAFRARGEQVRVDGGVFNTQRPAAR